MGTLDGQIGLCLSTQICTHCWMYMNETLLTKDSPFVCNASKTKIAQTTSNCTVFNFIKAFLEIKAEQVTPNFVCWYDQSHRRCDVYSY